MVEKFISMELELCLLINRLCEYRVCRSFFAAISRLGDGVFWYTLMLLLPFLYGFEAWKVSVAMATASLIGLLIYKLIKSQTERLRPYAVNEHINLGTAPLDKYSFPSGHTLHAVSFSIIAVYNFPELGWILIPFSMLVALSRVLLGLHYPTDVAAGAVIGSLLGSIAISLV